VTDAVAPVWHKTLAIIASAMVGLVTVIAGLTFLYVVFWPFQPLTVYGNLTVASPLHSTATVVQYWAKYCKTTDLPATLSITLKGVGPSAATTVPFAGFTSDAPPSCGTASITAHAFAPIPPGSYVLYESVSYTNPLDKFRTAVTHAHSNVFQVVP